MEPFSTNARTTDTVRAHNSALGKSRSANRTIQSGTCRVAVFFTVGRITARRFDVTAVSRFRSAVRKKCAIDDASLAVLCCPCSGRVARRRHLAERRWCYDAPLFEHDMQQATLDLGTPGTGPGDQFIYSGYLFDHAYGTKVEHTAGQCTTFSGNATAAGDVWCTATFVLDRGQITVQGLFDNDALFGRSARQISESKLRLCGTDQLRMRTPQEHTIPPIIFYLDTNFPISYYI
jgi:hypothetical protein